MVPFTTIAHRMRDARGVERGRCAVAGCGCDAYALPQKYMGCDYCGHKPAQHQELLQVILSGESSPPAPAATPECLTDEGLYVPKNAAERKRNEEAGAAIVSALDKLSEYVHVFFYACKTHPPSCY